MSTCHECGSELTGNDAFCPFCGISLRPIAPIAQELPSDDELESTIMMAPEDVARLAAELQSDPEGDDQSDDSSKEESTEEPISTEAVPVPVLLSELVKTSGDINARSTSDNISADNDERSEDTVSGAEDTKIELRDEVAIPAQLEQGLDAIHFQSEDDRSSDKVTDKESSEAEAIDTVDREAVEAASHSGTATSGISRPLDELPEHDPFKSGAMFDSVRIMESDLPDLQNDVDTILGVPVPVALEPAKSRSSGLSSGGNKEISHTAQNIGETGTEGRKSAKLKPLAEGTILNSRYEVIRKIGGGGMGAVYLASDNNLGGVLRAVKEMIQAHIEDEQQEKAINDFRRESMILSTLDHPSIPTIFDYFYDEAESRFYLVMKYISGGDLSSRLRSAPEGKIDETTVTEWAIQIADVLDYLHSQPSAIVYRDLKPSNIMVDGNSGRIMLIDFGIARSISQKEEKGVTAVGTMGYAPPELFSGNVEPRSDIYSLGSTMFHLLTGADPQSNPLLIFDFQKNPRPRQINPRLSDQMEQILMRAVEYNADARFASAGEIRSTLEAHLKNLRSGSVTYGISVVPASVSLSDQKVFCGFCGQRIVATDLFCAFCGAKQPIGQPGVQSGVYPKAAATAKLFVEGTGELSTPTFSLQKDEVLLGRRDPMSNIFPEVDLSKYDPQTKISRRHARIWRDGNNFLVEDLGSSNGTVLASSLSEAFRLVPHRPHPLASGDKLKIGDTTLHFLVG
ncbi:MAG: protein kinase [Pyrinomonadaceae bacterium]|nr:protein kinase [Pyrinomonadaceae bacterium]